MNITSANQHSGSINDRKRIYGKHRNFENWSSTWPIALKIWNWIRETRHSSKTLPSKVIPQTLPHGLGLGSRLRAFHGNKLSISPWSSHWRAWRHWCPVSCTQWPSALPEGTAAGPSGPRGHAAASCRIKHLITNDQSANILQILPQFSDLASLIYIRHTSFGASIVDHWTLSRF